MSVSFSPAFQFAVDSDSTVLLNGVCKHNIKVREKKRLTGKYVYHECPNCTADYLAHLEKSQREARHAEEKHELDIEERRLDLKAKELGLQAQEKLIIAGIENMTLASTTPTKGKDAGTPLSTPTPATPARAPVTPTRGGPADDDTSVASSSAGKDKITCSHCAKTYTIKKNGTPNKAYFTHLKDVHGVTE